VTLVTEPVAILIFGVTLRTVGLNKAAYSLTQRLRNNPHHANGRMNMISEVRDLTDAELEAVAGGIDLGAVGEAVGKPPRASAAVLAM